MVGQEHAKKVLSVAVYNHYKRIYHNIPHSDGTGSANLGNRTDAGTQDMGRHYPHTFSPRGNFVN